MTGATYRRSSRSRNRDKRRALTAASAAEAIGPIVPGLEVFGLSKGQFSLIDIVEHCLKATGPADVVISTWTAATADLDFALGFLGNGAIRSLRFIVDVSFPQRQPQYTAVLRNRFGDEAIRLTKSHAKFVIVENDAFALVIRSSMNLNENRRLESFEISDDRSMADYLRGVVDEVFAASEPGAQFERGEYDNARELDALGRSEGTYFGDGPLDRDVRRVGWTTDKGKGLGGGGSTRGARTGRKE